MFIWSGSSFCIILVILMFVAINPSKISNIAATCGDVVPAIAPVLSESPQQCLNTDTESTGKNIILKLWPLFIHIHLCDIEWKLEIKFYYYCEVLDKQFHFYLMVWCCGEIAKPSWPWFHYIVFGIALVLVYQMMYLSRYGLLDQISCFV